MIYQTFSPKQIQAMLWWAMPKFRQYDAIICDGSVRSGKTMAMSIGYLLWSMRSFDHETFAFCGKTIDSLKRNVVTPIQKWMAGVMQPKINLSKNYMDVEWRGHHNRYYFFGGKDESSYALIQGITLAGVLLDEVALMPRSFVDQATARCSVTGSKIWMNCNPDGSEEHWLYKEWIDSVHGKAGEKNRLHLHFTMEDNRALSVSVRKRYERMFRSYEKTDGQSFINTFSPEVRDTAYFHAFNQILRRIENAVGLSYGTLSEVSDVEKTAEEVRSSKQRSFSRVKDIQENLRNALEQMLYGMQFYQDYYRSQNSPPVKATFNFGDGVLEDPDVEYQRRVQMVRDGLLKPSLFLAWYFDCSEEKAAQMMPERQDDGGLFSGGEI